MRSLQSSHSDNHRKLHKCAIFIFICILVLHGTYFRIRPSVAVPTMDWLVFARLLVCAIGFIIGIILIPKNISWGFAAKILVLYVSATGLSAINSPYPTVVIGYFILLLGASVLMIGLIYRAENVVQLERIEKIWFITVSVLIIKDTITGLVFPEMQPEGEVVRLGMGVTHANVLSLLAGIIFWLSFTYKRGNYSVILWLLRAFLVYVIVGAISRVSIAAFLIGGLFYFLFKRRDYLKRWMIVFSCVVALSALFMLSLSFDRSWAKHIVGYAKRDQDTMALTTFSNRTLIWRHVMNKSSDSLLIGHGYGIARLTMGTLPRTGFQPAHCHNEVLEVFFTTGFLGLIPFLAMFIYCGKWIKEHTRLQRTFSSDMALHAVCVVVMLLVSSLFEARIGGKLSAVHPLFFLYLLTLDREKHFSKLCQFD